MLTSDHGFFAEHKVSNEVRSDESHPVEDEDLLRTMVRADSDPRMGCTGPAAFNIAGCAP